MSGGRLSWTADVDTYHEHGAFVAELAEPLIGLLAPLRGERILDLGCGDGRLSVILAQRGAEVVAVDSSPAMVNAARARGVEAHLLDGQQLDEGLGRFDAVFSNAALHWMPEADAVLAGVVRVLVPGGRFVAEFGGAGNVAAMRVAIRAALDENGVDRSLPPWFFPTADAYRDRLERHGFTVSRCELHSRPTLLETGVRSWFTTFLGDTLGPVDEEVTAALERAEALLEPILRDEQGRWWADYMRLRVHATR